MNQQVLEDDCFCTTSRRFVHDSYEKDKGINQRRCNRLLKGAAHATCHFGAWAN
jgi:hypothetical protein